MAAQIPREIREEMLAKIKGGAKASDVANAHGISPKTVYGWLGGAAKTNIGFAQYQKMKRERDGLLALVGELLLKTRRGEKNSFW